MPVVYKIFNVSGWLFGLAAFVSAGVAVFPKHPVLGILCFLVVVLGAVVAVIQRNNLFLYKRKKISVKDIVLYVVLTGVFIALLIGGPYNMATIMFGIAILSNIAANLTRAFMKS